MRIASVNKGAAIALKSSFTLPHCTQYKPCTAKPLRHSCISCTTEMNHNLNPTALIIAHPTGEPCCSLPYSPDVSGTVPSHPSSLHNNTRKLSKHDDDVVSTSSVFVSRICTKLTRLSLWATNLTQAAFVTFSTHFLIPYMRCLLL
jgi:hypothetical protein